jgi:hypothetical protein
MTAFLLALYLATLVLTVAGKLVSVAWQRVAMHMGASYATSPAPTPRRAVAWYSRRALRAVARLIVRSANA